MSKWEIVKYQIIGHGKYTYVRSNQRSVDGVIIPHKHVYTILNAKTSRPTQSTSNAT